MNIKEKEVNKNIKLIKSSLWILIKLVLKKCYGKLLQDKYKIINKISEFYYIFKDYSMKGTIIYLTNFAVQNKEIKSLVESFHVSYFFNSSITYPNDKSILSVENHYYENEKLKEDFNIINSKLKLNSESEKVYDNVTNFINGKTFKFSKLYLDEKYITNKEYFLDENLFIKILAFLSKYKLYAPVRRIILAYFENCIFSSSKALNTIHIMNNLRKNLLTSHKFEK